MTLPESIDVSDFPELKRIVEEAQKRQEPIVLRRGDQEIAIVTAIRPITNRTSGALTQEQFDTVMSAAGSWEDLIDVDEFLDEIYASRGSKRAPVEL
jgi:hypothetical protein